MLKTLPATKFPITQVQINPLMDGLVQLNVTDAGVDPRTQKALDILLHIWELYADTGGAVDYTGTAGHAKLYQDAVTLVPEVIVTKHGDLRAAHLALDFNNAQAKLKKAGFPLLSGDVNLLVKQCRDILQTPLRTEERMGLLLSWLARKQF